MLDQSQLIDNKIHGTAVGEQAASFADRHDAVCQQVKALSKTNVSPDKAAKAVLRTNLQTSAVGGPLDPDLVAVADRISKDPQGMAQILQEAKLTPESFANWARAAVNGANKRMTV